MRLKVRGDKIQKGDILCGYGYVTGRSRWSGGWILILEDHENNELLLGIREKSFYDVQRGQLALDL